jgi:hypothetical protein
MSTPATLDAVGLVERDRELSVAIDASGRIVAAGYTADGAAIEFALMRAHP